MSWFASARRTVPPPVRAAGSRLRYLTRVQWHSDAELAAGHLVSCGAPVAQASGASAPCAPPSAAVQPPSVPRAPSWLASDRAQVPGVAEWVDARRRQLSSGARSPPRAAAFDGAVAPSGAPAPTRGALGAVATVSTLSLTPTTSQEQAARHERRTIDRFYRAHACAVCGKAAHARVCPECASDPQRVIATAMHDLRAVHQEQARLARVCCACSGLQDGEVSCESLDCSVLFRRAALAAREETLAELRERALAFDW